MKYANEKLKQTVKELPTDPVAIAPDQYEVYIPSWAEDPIARLKVAAIDRGLRVVGKGLYSTKNLLPPANRTKLDDDTEKMIVDALEKGVD